MTSPITSLESTIDRMIETRAQQESGQTTSFDMKKLRVQFIKQVYFFLTSKELNSRLHKLEDIWTLVVTTTAPPEGSPELRVVIEEILRTESTATPRRRFDILVELALRHSLASVLVNNTLTSPDQQQKFYSTIQKKLIDLDNANALYYGIKYSTSQHSVESLKAIGKVLLSLEEVVEGLKGDVTFVKNQLTGFLKDSKERELNLASKLDDCTAKLAAYDLVKREETPSPVSSIDNSLPQMKLPTPREETHLSSHNSTQQSTTVSI